VTIGIIGGTFLGLLNVLLIFIATKNLKLQTYFFRTILKFAVILTLFYILLKLQANVIAILSGFALPILIITFEAIRCKLLKKQ